MEIGWLEANHPVPPPVNSVPFRRGDIKLIPRELEEAAIIDGAGT